MYSHNAWHNFWQQRVQKERIVQERHLPEYHGRHRGWKAKKKVEHSTTCQSLHTSASFPNLGAQSQDTCPDFSSQNGVRDALLTKRSLSVRSDYRSSRPTNEIKWKI
eukprot:GEMP01101559.1.p1 GENE.GEMP01101559.1~~GEMP01101559.1.p1  ORF type:complete len:117 (+),score=13.69 GEMP01101559.1:33-353(+)